MKTSTQADLGGWEAGSTATLYSRSAFPSGLDALADLLDGRSDNWRAVCGVVKLQVHATTDEAHLEHGTAPCRAGNGDLNRFRTVFGMSREQRRTLTQKECRVEVVLGANVQHGVWRQALQKDASLNLRLDDIPIHLVAEVGMRRKG